jgi:hypothetical protein
VTPVYLEGDGSEQSVALVTTRHYDEVEAAWTGNGRRERDLAFAAAPVGPSPS